MYNLSLSEQEFIFLFFIQPIVKDGRTTQVSGTQDDIVLAATATELTPDVNNLNGSVTEDLEKTVWEPVENSFVTSTQKNDPNQHKDTVS